MAFLFDWVYGVLAALGLYYKDAKLLFLGLDNAGKTTLLYTLKSGKLGSYNPTIAPNHEELIIGKVRFKTFDLGGHETAQKLWREYFASGVDGVVFVADASDRERFPEANRALNSLLTSEELKDVPFLILGNKVDLGSAASEDELRFQLGLSQTYGKEPKAERDDRMRPIEVYMCSIINKAGYGDGFKWLSQFL
eukprot:GSChrysophyteH2.ASY1.ANO1.353.1 assembled CDS